MFERVRSFLTNPPDSNACGFADMEWLELREMLRAKARKTTTQTSRPGGISKLRQPGKRAVDPLTASFKRRAQLIVGGKQVWPLVVHICFFTRSTD